MSSILYLENIRPDDDAISGGVESQFASIFKKIEKHLQDKNLEWSDIVSAWIRLADMKGYFPSYNALWRDHFSTLTPQQYPCRTTVSVSNLDGGVVMEMDILARKKDASFTLRNSPRAPDAVGLYSHAIQFDDTLYVAGIGPRKKGDTAIPGVTMSDLGIKTSYDIITQIRSVLDNIGFIIEDAGFDWSALSSGRFYLTNMEDLDTLKSAWADYFIELPEHKRPSFNVLKIFDVSALPTPIDAEMDCVFNRKGFSS